MKKRVLQVVIAFAVLLTAAQLVRPDLSGAAIDHSRTIEAQAGTGAALAAVLNQSCADCHSNAAVHPAWFTKYAPLSWVMAYAVREGRKAVNFSEWAGYSADRQQALLGLSCSDVSTGKMPSAYTAFRPETKLTAENIETICAAARPSRARAAASR